jgi:hypothetical protein
MARSVLSGKSVAEMSTAERCEFLLSEAAKNGDNKEAASDA